MNRWIAVCVVSSVVAMSGCGSDAADPGGGDAEGLDASGDQGSLGQLDHDGGARSMGDTAVIDTEDASTSIADSSQGGAVEETSPPAEEVSPPDDEPFSFFVTSIEAMRELSGSMDGFGGDLGGLEGADAICQTIAATVDGGHKTWRAFLSVTSGPDGEPVHAIDRIGDGPWYDRNGRLVAMNKTDLLTERPTGDPQIIDDLPNEFGQGQKQFGDNHDTLTGSNAQGMLNSTDPASTCMDWTSAGTTGFEGKVMGGHSWPREHQDGGGGGGQVPQAWLTACAGSGEGDACEVTSGPAQFTSTCQASGDDAFACLPPVPPPWLSACSDSAQGDACEVTKGPSAFESTCALIEDTDMLACMPEGFVPSDGGGGGQNPVHWIAAHNVPGCAPGVQLEQRGGGQGTGTVGGGGGYGGIYCFALTP